MKKLFLIIASTLFLVSCGPRRFCGGAGGKRCVEIEKSKTSTQQNFMVNKENYKNS